MFTILVIVFGSISTVLSIYLYRGVVLKIRGNTKPENCNFFLQNLTGIFIVHVVRIFKPDRSSPVKDSAGSKII